MSDVTAPEAKTKFSLKLSKKRWIAVAVVFAIGSGLMVWAGNTFIKMSQPPEVGVFQAALEGPEGPELNISQTLFEEVVDTLSGNRVPVLLYPEVTNYCRGPVGEDYVTAACVSRHTPNHIAVQQEFVYRYAWAWNQAKEAGLEKEARDISQWEAHMAAHEFAHILQYNYRAQTLPFLNVFGDGEIEQVELLAECYASLVYPMESSEMTFYTFPEPERFPACTDLQFDTTKKWLKEIGWDNPPKVASLS